MTILANTSCGDRTGRVFESLKEDRGPYFVEYTPAFEGWSFAILVLVYTREQDKTQVAEAMERECEAWVGRFPVPLRVTAFDNTDDVIRLNGVRDCDNLFGIPSDDAVALRWRHVEEHAFPDGPLDDARLLAIYGGVPSTTRAERTAKGMAERRALRYGLVVIAFWLIAVPTTVAVIGIASPLFGVLVAAFGIVKGGHRALRLMGYIRPGEIEKAKEAELLRMRHHHYHCERNPDGFQRLLAESYDKDTKAETEREHSELKRCKDRNEGLA